MRHVVRLAIVVLVLLSGAAVFLTENALHVWNSAAQSDAEAAAIARQGAATWKAVRIAAADGAILQAWLFTPRTCNGAAIVLIHGVGDNRMGMSGHAPFLLRAGHTVLTPDSRGHGSSW